MATKIKWENADFKWEKAPTDDTQPRYTWDEVLLVEEIAEVASSDSALSAVKALEPEKKKRFIRLICKVKGIETYSGQKTVREDIEVTAEDCEMVIKEVLGIDLTVENINV